MSAAATIARRFGRPRARVLLREQALVASAQGLAGAGNLGFALVAARLLAPGAFAAVVAFLALYLLVHVPAGSLSAGSALRPGLARVFRPRVLRWGAAAGLVLAALSIPLGALLGVPAALLAILAGALPLAGWLALERGRLYGEGRHARVATSLVVEPALRLALGLPLAATLGPAGAALGVLAGGWAALAATRPRLRERDIEHDIRATRRAHRDGREVDHAIGGKLRVRPTIAHERSVREAAAAGPGTPPGDAGGARSSMQTDAAGPATPPERSATKTRTTVAIGAFLALALVQNQDAVLANALLDPTQAGRFAVLSTLGGAAAFATTTIPLVLLPRARADEPGALAIALVASAALGALVTAVVAGAPAALVGTAFGARYASVGSLAVPYVGAMALFGVARVLIAHRCATRASARVLAAPAAVVAAQAALIATIGRDAAAVAAITLAAMAALVAVTALQAATGAVARLPRHHADAAAAQTTPRAPARTLWAVAGITVVALAVRLAITRGIWLDEATSITQAQMSLGDLLHNLRTTDVHPPLHHLILFCLAHTAGIGELVMRAPSIVAGTALIPILYLTGTELWDRRAGLAAAALGAVAPFLVWYSQEARMYALFMLFGTLALLGQLYAVRRGRKRDWALYAGASAALVWTQYFGLLIVGVQQVAFALTALRRRDRRLIAGWLLATLALAAALAPLVPFAADQFQANQAAGRGFDAPSQAGADVASIRDQPGVYVALTNVVWAIWGYHSNATMASITALWPLILLGGLLLLGRGRSPRTLLVVACALVPAIALFAVGEVKPFLFEIRYFAELAPLAVLLLARAATAWTRGAAAATAAVAVLATSLGVAAADQQLNGTNPRLYDFNGAVALIERQKRPADTVLIAPPYLRDVVGYYGADLHARPLKAGLPDHPRGRIFILGSFLEKPQIRDGIHAKLRKLRDEGHRVVRRIDLPQIRIWVIA